MCQGPLDCNARHCYDCACTNQACSCADGWFGDQCQTPFCRTRAECSFNGDCAQTLHAIACSCDSGYTGPRCGVAVCSLKCRHGGTPDAQCKTCQGCLGAWSGPTCEVFDHSVPAAGLLADMETNFKAAQQQLKSEQNLLCTNGQECPGWGVDIFDGSVRNLILAMTPDTTNPAKHYRKFVAPKEVTFTPFVKSALSLAEGAGVFAQPSDVVAFVDGLVGQNKGLAGFYTEPWASALSRYFNSDHDTALSVVQGRLALFKMAIPDTKNVVFDRHFMANLLALPSKYSTPTERALFDKFFELYGTNMVVQSSGGGLLEQRSRWNTPLIATLDKPTLLANAKIDFSASTGLGGKGGVLSPSYARNRVLEGGGAGPSYLCYGGDPSQCGTPQWQSSLPDNPVLLDYSTVPLSQLLSACPQTAADPTLRVAMEMAVSGYFAKRKAQWKAVNKCPKRGCNGRGHCRRPAEQCTCVTRPPKGSKCKMAPPLGRMCSKPRQIFMGGTRKVSAYYALSERNGQDVRQQPGVVLNVACVNGKAKRKPAKKSPFKYHQNLHLDGFSCITDARGRVKVVMPTLPKTSGTAGTTLFVSKPCAWSASAKPGSLSSCSITHTQGDIMYTRFLKLYYKFVWTCKLL